MFTKKSILIFMIVFIAFFAIPFQSAPSRTIRLLYPQGCQFPNQAPYGEAFYVGEVVEIKWTTTGEPGGKVKIWYQTSPTTPSTLIGCFDNTGSYRWRVPDVATGTAKIHIDTCDDCQYPRQSYAESGFFRILPLKILGFSIRMNPPEIRDGERINSIECDIENKTSRNINATLRIVEPADQYGRGLIFPPDRPVVVRPGINHYQFAQFCDPFRKPTGNNKFLSVEVLTGHGVEFKTVELIETGSGSYKLKSQTLRNPQPIKRF